MHQSPEVVTPESQSPGAAAPHHAGATRWLVVLAAAVLVLGPILGTGLHRERARWRVAAALEHWLNDDLSAALADLDAAAKLAPEETEVYALRSQWRIYAQDYSGALADAEKVLEATPRSMRGIQLKGDALMYLGRGREAAKLWAEFAAVPQTQYDLVDVSLLNGVAYYRALGGQNLDTAWLEINAALARLGQAGDSSKAQAAWQSAQVAFLDARGYLRFLRGDYEGAVADLTPAVVGAEKQHQQQHLDRATAVRMGMIDPRVVAWQLKEVDRTLAVIRYHRGLALKALDEPEAAERDFRRVRELGYEPGPKLF